MEANSELTRPNKDEFYMALALLAAKRSKDPKLGVGACLVSPDGKILGIGYNGHPKVDYDRNNDIIFDWNDDKHLYVCHAELNAILHSAGPVKGASLYVTLQPCNACAKAIVQSEIAKVYYLKGGQGKSSFEGGVLEASEKILLYSKVHSEKFSSYMHERYGNWTPNDILSLEMRRHTAREPSASTARGPSASTAGGPSVSITGGPSVSINY
jgi:dCMP deaminase